MNKIIFGLLSFIFILSGCEAQVDYQIHEYNNFAFDTPINIKIYYTDEDTFDFPTIDTQLTAIISNLQNQFDPTEPSSDLSSLNQTGSLQMSEDFKTILTTTLDYCQLTDGRYDPSSGSLINLWSINNQNYLPTTTEIDDALEDVGCEQIEITGNTVTIPQGMALDFGSIVKGYAADQIQVYLQSVGVYSALINLGGNVQTIGVKPDGSVFKVGVLAPEIDNSDNHNALTIEATNKSIVTSGINQRYFVQDGVIYPHIIDATTGAPVQNGLASVTIITNDDGITADILSTVCFILGLDAGMELISSLDNTEAIFITQDKQVYPSSDQLGMEIVDNDYQLNDEYLD